MIDREAFDRDGFVRLPGFADRSTCDAMLDRVVALTRQHSEGEGRVGLVLPEANLASRSARQPEDLVSKVFLLHRDEVFGAFARDPRVTDLVAELIAPELDCFLSQFIFKNPAAWGQPWHQDSY